MSDPIKLGLAAWYNESATYELPYSDDEKASMRRALAAAYEARIARLEKLKLDATDHDGVCHELDIIISDYRMQIAELREER